MTHTTITIGDKVAPGLYVTDAETLTSGRFAGMVRVTFSRSLTGAPGDDWRIYPA